MDELNKILEKEKQAQALVETAKKQAVLDISKEKQKLEKTLEQAKTLSEQEKQGFLALQNKEKASIETKHNSQLEKELAMFEEKAKQNFAVAVKRVQGFLLD